MISCLAFYIYQLRSTVLSIVVVVTVSMSENNKNISGAAQSQSEIVNTLFRELRSISRNDVMTLPYAFIATSGSLRSRHPQRVWRPERRQYVFVFRGDEYVACTSQCRLRSLRENPL